MIAFIKGSLAAHLQDAAIIEVGGMGMLVGMSSHSLSSLPNVGETVQIHTYLQVREDALTLFGFVTQEEKALFERLIGVSGVGPKVALSALSSYTPKELAQAIMAGDVTAVSRIPGIGKKTSQRIILELQGILAKEDSLTTATPPQTSTAIKQALEDLLAMGFTQTEGELALKGAPAGATEQALLHYALKRLAG